MTLSVIGFNGKRFAGRARLLAGVLAAIVLLLGLLATNGAFHQTLHQNGQGTSHSCILCLFAQGHLDTPEALPFITPAAQPCSEPAPRLESIVLADYTSLAFPSRAPPASAASLVPVA